MSKKPARGLGLILTADYFTKSPTTICSVVSAQGVANPINSRAFGILGAVTEPIPINVLLGG